MFKSIFEVTGYHRVTHVYTSSTQLGSQARTSALERLSYESQGMGAGSSRKADICYYTYVFYVFYTYMVDQFYQPIFYSCYQLDIFSHCISIAGGTFQLDETVLTTVSLKRFWQQKISKISFWEALHCITLVQIAGARELDFCHAFPGMLRISLMPTRTVLWTKPQILPRSSSDDGSSDVFLKVSHSSHKPWYYSVCYNVFNEWFIYHIS